MMYLKIKNGKVKIGPADERGEREILEVIQLLKQRGLSVIEVETDYDEGQHPRHEHYRFPDHQDTPRRYNPYGYGAQSYMPMPPDFSPQAHYAPPIILPVIWERDGGRGGRRGPRMEYDYDDYDRRPGGGDGRRDSRREYDYPPLETPRRPPLRPANDDDKKAP